VPDDEWVGLGRGDRGGWKGEDARGVEVEEEEGEEASGGAHCAGCGCGG